MPVSEPRKLKIPSIPAGVGNGNGVHPSAVRIPDTKKLNGYEYWMAFTPYYNGNDDYENPSILASNNGIDWETPAGLTNPVIPAPADVATGGYNSDPCLLFDNDNKLLIMYYRYVTAAGVKKTFRVTSSDGVTWSAPTQCTFAVDTSNANVQPTPSSIDAVSPKVIRISSTLWYMYFTMFEKIYRARSSDGIAFLHPKRVQHNLPVNCRAWHLDVSCEETGFYALLSAFLINETAQDTVLYYGYSPDGVLWQFDKEPLLMPHSDVGWMSKQVYKSCMVRNDKGGHRVYISAQSKTGTGDATGYWFLGYFEAKRTNVSDKFDSVLTVPLIDSSDNITIAAGNTFTIETILSFPGSKAGLLVKLNSSANFSASLEYRADYHGFGATYNQPVISAGAARSSDGAQVNLCGRYGVFKIKNEDTVAITLNSVIATLFPSG